MWFLGLILFLSASAEPSLTFVRSPEFVRLDDAAGTIRSEDVSNVISNAMGFESSSTQTQWGGLLNGNAFQRPSACLTVLVDGFTDDLPLPQSLVTYPLSSSSAEVVLLGSSFTSVASQLSESAESFTVSMSSNRLLAQLGASRDVGAGRDFTIFQSETGFSDHSNTFSVSSRNMDVLFSSGLFGPQVVFHEATKTFTVAVDDYHVAFDISDASTRNFFFELHAMSAVLSSVVARPAVVPTAVTLSIASVKEMTLSAVQRHAVRVVLARAIDSMGRTFSEAFAHSALVVAVTSAAAPATRHVVARSAGTASNTWAPPATASDFIAYCATYTCFCNVDSNNQLFDTTTGCQPNCNRTLTCECANLPCTCGSRAQPGAARCATCVSGFTLQGGQCYVDSNYPGMFQIWFWGGLGIALALLATCHAIGNMDPGRNGIVYRMTSMRPKTN